MGAGVLKSGVGWSKLVPLCRNQRRLVDMGPGWSKSGAGVSKSGTGVSK